MADNLIVSYEEVDRLCDLIVKQIRHSRRIYLNIVTIARGGIIPAAILGYKLGINQIDIIHNPRDPNRREFYKSDLLIDEISDSGDTLMAVLNRADLHPDIATLYYKPQTKVIPKYFGDITDRWVVFPWENIKI